MEKIIKNKRKIVKVNFPRTKMRVNKHNDLYIKLNVKNKIYALKVRFVIQTS